MKIVIDCLKILPELTGIRINTRVLDSCRDARGLALRLGCPPFYYWDWKVASVYKAARDRSGLYGLGRCLLWVPSNPTGYNDILNSASFALASVPVVVLQRSWRLDIVCVVCSTFICLLGNLCISQAHEGLVG